MTATLLDHLILWGVGFGALAYTIFVPAFAWWAAHTWRLTLIGWGLMVATSSTALLLDLTLLFRVWEPSPLFGLWATLIVVVLIAAGGWIKLAALGWEMVHHRRVGRKP